MKGYDSMNLIKALFGTPTKDVRTLCEVGPCPCGQYLAHGCHPAKGCADMCVNIGHLG
jgi:hypothetical protein